MKNSKNLAKTILATSGLFLLVGCQQTATPTIPATPASSPVSQTNPTTDQRPTDISIENMTFLKGTGPTSIGNTIKWTNNDSVPHTVTSDTGLFDSGTLQKGQSFEYKFTTAGTFSYHCSIHPSMKGTIIAKSAKDWGTVQ